MDQIIRQIDVDAAYQGERENTMPTDTEKPMTDDEFRQWALGEVQRATTVAASEAVDAWVRDNAPDELTVGAARLLKRMVRGLVDRAVKSGFDAGTSRSGPKVK